MLRGVERAGAQFIFTMAAYNLARLPAKTACGLKDEAKAPSAKIPDTIDQLSERIWFYPRRFFSGLLARDFRFAPLSSAQF